MSGFVHRAMFYRDDREWLDGLVPFVRGAVQADEPVMVAVPRVRVELLRDALSTDAQAVDFAAMEVIGKNPGRIISQWHDFVDRHPGRRLRGVGEPLWPGRATDEVTECQHNEHLVNLAFAGHDMELVCPYDVAALPDAIIGEASRSHPFAGDMGNSGAAVTNPSYTVDLRHTSDLTPPPDHAQAMRFDRTSLRAVRQMVSAAAAERMTDRGRVDDLVLAVSEAATNSVQYGNGGLLTMWADHGRLICEITDSGQLADPLVGRRRPSPTAPSGRGVWMVQQMCDLVQIRSGDDGTRVRLAMEFGST